MSFINGMPAQPQPGAPNALFNIVENYFDFGASDLNYCVQTN